MKHSNTLKYLWFNNCRKSRSASAQSRRKTGGFTLCIFLLSGLIYSFCAMGQAGPCAEIKTVQDQPTLYVDGNMVPPFAYMSYLGKAKYYKEMSNAKVRIFNVPAYLGDQGINSTSGIGVFRPSMWIGPGQYNLSRLKRDMEEIISSAEDPLIVIRIHLDPPRWWEAKNSEELCLLPDQSSYRVSFYSEKWREEYEAMNDTRSI